MKQIEFSLDYGTRVVAYLHDPLEGQAPSRAARPAVVIFPGGAYAFCSDREADPVAIPLFEKGYQVFVAFYPVLEEAANMQPLASAARTLTEIRAHAADWMVDSSKIAVCGFSAGGHLAASIATLWGNPKLQKMCGITGRQARPDAAIFMLSGDYGPGRKGTGSRSVMSLVQKKAIRGRRSGRWKRK